MHIAFVLIILVFGMLILLSFIFGLMTDETNFYHTTISLSGMLALLSYFMGLNAEVHSKQMRESTPAERPFRDGEPVERPLSARTLFSNGESAEHPSSDGEPVERPSSAGTRFSDGEIIDEAGQGENVWQ